MNKEYFTMKECCDLTGKSERTIQRFVKRINESGTDEEKQKLKRERALHGGTVCLIHRELLHQSFDVVYKSRSESESENHYSAHANGSEHHELVEIHEKNLNNEKQTIDVLTEQLSAKNEHINALLDRQREVNTILVSLQNEKQKLLEAPEIKKKRFSGAQLTALVVSILIVIAIALYSLISFNSTINSKNKEIISIQESNQKNLQVAVSRQEERSNILINDLNKEHESRLRSLKDDYSQRSKDARARITLLQNQNDRLISTLSGNSPENSLNIEKAGGLKSKNESISSKDAAVENDKSS